MKTRKAITITVVLLLLLIYAVPVASNPNDSIIVNNADTVRQDSFNMSQNLLDLFAAVAPRIIVEFSNTIRHEGLVATSAGLNTLLDQVTERIIIQVANGNRYESLTYPITLFNDNTAPHISGLTSERCIIAWSTDEFANSTVMYGTQSGDYPMVVVNTLYTKQHSVALSGLTSGQTYYLIVSSTDRSGNTSTSSEITCTETLSVFLPIIVASN